jgi:hypothetical protein
MHGLKNTSKDLTISFNVDELSPTQVRLLKNINSLLVQVMTSEDEAEYFEMSAELMKKAAEVIKQSTFSETKSSIDYGTQAVEYAMDFLNESLDQKKIQNFDN